MSEIKDFYLQNTSLDVAVSLLQIAYLGVIIVFLVSRLASSARKVGFISLGYFLILCALIPVDIAFNVVPSFPDSDFYMGVFDIGGSQFGEKRAYAIYEFIFLICRPIFIITSPLGLIVFQKFTVVVSVLIISVSTPRILLKNSDSHTKERMEITTLVLLCAYPALAIFTAAPLREYIFLFNVALIFASAMLYTEEKRALALVLFGISILLMYYVRYHMIIAIISLCGLLFLLNIKSILYRFLLLPIAILAFGAIGSLFTASIGFSSLFTPAGFSNLRRWFFHAYGETGLVYGQGVFYSYYDMLVFAPAMTAQFLFAPLPILVDYNERSGISTTVDALYVILLSIYVLINIQNFLKDKRFKLLIAVFLVATVPTAMFEFFISSVPRHRVPTVILLVITCSYIFTVGRSISVSRRSYK